MIPLQPIFDLLTFSNVNLDKCMTIINRRIIRDRLALRHWIENLLASRFIRRANSWFYFKHGWSLKLRACGSVCNKIIFEKGVSSVVFLIYKFSALYNPLVNHLLIIFKARSMIQLFKTFVEYLLIPKMSPETVLNKSLSNMHC